MEFTLDFPFIRDILKQKHARARDEVTRPSPATQDIGRAPPMHQNSAVNRHRAMNGRTCLPGRVRYPRKISFGGNLYLLVMPKGGRYWRYCYRYSLIRFERRATP
jgi:hypothetical protein